MLDFGKPVLNAVLVTAHVKHMGHVRRGWASRIARWKCELNAVVGQYRVNFVGDGFD